MLKKFQIVLVVFFTLTLANGCKSDNTPEDILSEEQMTAIFLDFYETEAVLTNFEVGRDTAMVLFHEYEQNMFDSVEFSRDDYLKSLTYYYDHPDKLEKIYEVIIDTLTLRESKIKAMNEAKRQKRDSINNVEREAKRQKGDSTKKTILLK